MQKGGTPAGGHHASTLTTADGPKYDTSYQPHGRSTGAPSRRGTSNSAGSSSRRGTTPHSSGRHELYVIAVNENRMKEVGLAIMDLRRPELLLTQFTDSKSYSFTTSKLATYAPVEVLLPNTAIGSELYEAIKENFRDTDVIDVNRKYFSESYGAQTVSRLVVPENSSIEHSVSSKYLALASAAALVKYVEFIQHMTFAPNSLKIQYKPVDGTMMIDPASIENLEIVVNARTKETKGSLFDVLNHTKTISGGRLLRINLLQPPSDMPTTTTRLECIEEFLGDERMFFDVSAVLGRFLDLDSLLLQLVRIPKKSSIQSTRANLVHILELKHTLETVPPLAEALKGCQNSLLQAILNNLQDPRIEALQMKLEDVVREDAIYVKNTHKMRNQLAYAIKPGIHGLLDVARKSWTEANDDMQLLIKRYREEFCRYRVRAEYNTRRGHHLSCPIVAGDHLPQGLVQVVKKGKKWAFSTEEMISLNARINESMDEIFLLTDRVIEELLSETRKFIGCIYKIAEAVALIDLICSFTTYVTVTPSCVRPELTTDGPLAIKQGRNPLVEKLFRDPFIPNDTFITEASNFHVITGPNMSGKSTYLRQVALLTILAHVGCFVPATFASFRLVDRLFTRIGTSDCMERNSSTFMVEMKEMAFIIQNATNHSLMIIDELGRGSSYLDGASIAWAICEYLLSLRAYTLCATHYMQLADLEAIYPNAKNYHLQVEHDRMKLRPTFMYTLKEGPTDLKFGLVLAEIAGFPPDAVAAAREIHRKLQQSDTAKKEKEAQHLRELSQLAQRLLNLKTSTLSPELLRRYLTNLKEKFIAAQHEE